MSDEVECYELVLRYRDCRRTVSLPYLGQATMDGTLYTMLKDLPPPALYDLTPRRGVPAAVQETCELIEAAFPEAPRRTASPCEECWYEAESGMRAAHQLTRALDEPWAVANLPEQIRLGMREELADLLMALSFAGGHGIGFHFLLRVCQNPPPAVVAWWRETRAEVAADIREAMKAAGVSDDVLLSQGVHEPA